MMNRFQFLASLIFGIIPFKVQPDTKKYHRFGCGLSVSMWLIVNDIRPVLYNCGVRVSYGRSSCWSMMRAYEDFDETLRRAAYRLDRIITKSAEPIPAGPYSDRYYHPINGLPLHWFLKNGIQSVIKYDGLRQAVTLFLKYGKVHHLYILKDGDAGNTDADLDKWITERCYDFNNQITESLK